MYTHSERDTHFDMLLGGSCATSAACHERDPLVVSILTKSGFPPQGAVMDGTPAASSRPSSAARRSEKNETNEDESSDSDDDSYDERILRMCETKLRGTMLSAVSPKRRCAFDFVSSQHQTTRDGVACR